MDEAKPITPRTDMGKKKQPPSDGPGPGTTWDGLSYLSCDRLGDLDHGFAREVIDQSLTEISADVDQRGEDGKPRKVVVTVTMTKIGDKGDVKVEFGCETKLPARSLAPTVAVLRTEGGRPAVAFRADNPARHDQPTIPFDPEAGGDAGEGE